MIIAKVPLRISLCGGGTDFESFYRLHGGMVLTCAIDKYIYVTIKERFDDRIVLNYTQHEIVDNVSDIKHTLIRECLKLYGIEKGVEISTIADIPSEGSGLGSSSAVVVGLLTALGAFVGKPESPLTIAQWACGIEIDGLGKPIGKQDQYAVAFGGMNNIIFETNGNVLVNKIDQKYYDLGDNLFLHYTDITRSADTILADQVQNIPNKISGLKELSYMAHTASEAIQKYSNYDVIGSILKKNWDIKKGLARGITNATINKMIDTATNSGATGCKIAGAGGGGFLLSYVPLENQATFKIGMSKYRELPFNIDPYGSRIIFNIQ